MSNSIKLSDLAGKSPAEILDVIGYEDEVVDPFVVADMLGVRVNQEFRWEDQDKSGCITKLSDDDFDIWLNPTDFENRRKFTLAHELGHLFKHLLVNGDTEFKDTPTTLYRSGESCLKEWEANTFAAQLLMPKKTILRVLDELLKVHQKMPLDQLVYSLANRLKVSQAAMRVRLKTLNIIS